MFESIFFAEFPAPDIKTNSSVISYSWNFTVALLPPTPILTARSITSSVPFALSTTICTCNGLAGLLIRVCLKTSSRFSI